MFDTIVIGKGPAGISAAIYLKRAGFNVIVIGKDSGSLEKAGLIENYYGIKPENGKKLSEDGIKQAESLGVNVINDEVTGIEFFDAFTVKTVLDIYTSKTVLFAIGRKRKTAGAIFEKFAGNGVSYCAVCDGFFFKNKNAAVIGSGNYAVSEAKYLKNIVKDVKIFTDGEEESFSVTPEFAVIRDKITGVSGTDRVQAIETVNGNYPTDGIFIAKGSAGATDFAVKLGMATENGNIAVDGDFASNVPGVFAAGDCIGGFLQVSKAVSDGANAANAITKYLRKH